MPNYRRLRVTGGTYFFTVNLQDRRSDLLTKHAGKLKHAYNAVIQDWPVETLALCILPDHLHCIWQLPDGDDRYSTRWRLIKTRFSKSLQRTADPAESRRPGERGIWQRRYWEHLVRDEDELEAYTNYIHLNPVKHGLVEDIDDWPHSTWHDYKKTLGRTYGPNDFANMAIPDHFLERDE